MFSQILIYWLKSRVQTGHIKMTYIVEYFCFLVLFSLTRMLWIIVFHIFLHTLPNGIEWLFYPTPSPAYFSQKLKFPIFQFWCMFSDSASVVLLQIWDSNLAAHFFTNFQHFIFLPYISCHSNYHSICRISPLSHNFNKTNHNTCTSKLPQSTDKSAMPLLPCSDTCTSLLACHT